MIWMLFALVASDPTADAVRTALASYAGIAGLVVALVGGIKRLWPAWIDKKEPAVAVISTFVLGISGKICLPDVYGANDVKGWIMHAICLALTAAGAKVLHDGLVNAFTKKE